MTNTPDRNTFVDLLKRRLRELGEDRELRYDPTDFSLHIGTLGTHRHLRRGYQAYCAAAPVERSAVLQRWSEILRSEPPWPQDIAALKSSLRLQIVSRSFTQVLRLQTSDDAQALEGQPACVPVAADWGSVSGHGSPGAPGLSAPTAVGCAQPRSRSGH